MKFKYMPALFSASGMLVLILDAKTALLGASEGLQLCLQTVIPSLFPFLLLSILLTSSVASMHSGIFSPLGKLLKIPADAVGIFLIGLLGGYPAGAQAVATAYGSGRLSRQEAGRMVVFCNNTGPAFLFGIGAVLFDSFLPCLLLWVIQILSSIAMASLLPGEWRKAHPINQRQVVSVTQAMRQAVQTMALICGWVILFRILIAFLQRWILWLLPQQASILICALLEMTNGCCALSELSTDGAKLILFAVFSGFGGLCVWLQSCSVTAQALVPMGLYLPGKITQACLCLLLAAAAQILLPVHQRFFPPLYILLPAAALCFFYAFLCRNPKIKVAFRRKLLYNE